MWGERIVDPRVEMAALLARLQDGASPQWITWHGRRLLLAAPIGNEATTGACVVLARTRRGYVLRHLTGPMPQPGGRLVVRDCGWKVVPQKQICAIVVEDHPRT